MRVRARVGRARRQLTPAMRLRPRRRGAQTEVDAVAERPVVAGRAGDIESGRLRELRLVTVRGGVEQERRAWSRSAAETSA